MEIIGAFGRLPTGYCLPCCPSSHYCHHCYSIQCCGYGDGEIFKSCDGSDSSLHLQSCSIPQSWSHSSHQNQVGLGLLAFLVIDKAFSI